MTFDPKMMAKYPAFATAGGVVLGLGIWWFILTVVENLVRPIFHIVKASGTIHLWDGGDIGFSAILSACVILVAAVVVGFGMIKLAGK